MKTQTFDKSTEQLIQKYERFIAECVQENAEYKAKIAANEKQIQKLRRYNRELKGRETA